MELRHLRYFVAVAEELSFTRAAKRLGIKQPPLSLQIRQLEKEMGTPLFRRLTRGVELTDAGKLMLEEARVILGQVERATVGVRRRARGETGRINVGSSGGTYFHPLIPAIIREYGKRYPDIVLAPEASNTALLVARVCAGQVDIAFIWSPIIESDSLATELLVDEEAVMALPAGHALANSASAPLAAFAKETFILNPRGHYPAYDERFIADCRRAGFDPKRGQEASDISVIPLVAAGLGVSIVPRSFNRIRTEGVAFVAIEGDAPRVEIRLAHRRDDHSPAVQNFVAVARRVSRTAVERENYAVAKRG